VEVALMRKTPSGIASTETAIRIIYMANMGMLRESRDVGSHLLVATIDLAGITFGPIAGGDCVFGGRWRLATESKWNLIVFTTSSTGNGDGYKVCASFWAIRGKRKE
jgi:hypothetical protein